MRPTTVNYRSFDADKYVLGLLLRGGFRRLLNMLRFLGDVDDYYEEWYPLGSEFYVRFKTDVGRTSVSSWFQFQDNLA